MGKVMLKNNYAVAVAGVCACMVTYLLYASSWQTRRVSLEVPTFVLQAKGHLTDYDVWPTFQAPQNEFTDQTWFQKACLPFQIDISISNLALVLSHWARSSDSNCRELLVKFQTLYSVSTRNASVVLPQPFQVKVKKWLGNNEKLFKEVYHQHLRGNRQTTEVAMPLKSVGISLNQILKETARTCDFCHFKNYTAEHTFFRVENEYAFSASNIFKMDTLHALFVMKQHDPLKWSPASFLGLMELSVTWFKKAHKAYPSAHFPSLIWDVLPKCGASQVHPHVHGLLDPERYHGVAESWRRGAQDYFSIMGSNFYMDMAKVSASLGLAVTHRTAVAFASLVPRKDHEVVVMAPTAGRDFFEMVYFVLRAFVDDVGKFCFSMGMAYPALDGLEAVIPAYARIITRGVVTNIRADMSSLELFAATDVNIDPFKVAKLVRTSAEKRRSTV